MSAQSQGRLAKKNWTREELGGSRQRRTQKEAAPLSAAQAMEWIEQWTAFPCLDIDHQLVRIAIEPSERYAISHWDAAIPAAAEALGTDTVYSEDLSHGQRYGRVRVLNPFA